jgi:hypothetical protein
MVRLEWKVASSYFILLPDHVVRQESTCFIMALVIQLCGGFYISCQISKHFFIVLSSYDMLQIAKCILCFLLVVLK